MKRVQRTFGGLLKRSADQQDVGAVLAEFKSADDMLSQMVKDLTTWRNAWEDVLKLQYDGAEALANLYKPIAALPTDPQTRHVPVETPQVYVQKCLGLQKTYSDVRVDLAMELALIDKKLIAPAEAAKQSTKALQKTVKHRENTKLDYERYLSRAEHARRKDVRSPKEEAALATHESNLAQAQIDYETADEHVKQTFPPLVEAVIGLLPFLRANQIMLQTTMVGQLYTVLDAYTKHHHLANPAPSDADIVRAWDGEFAGFRREMEQKLQVLAEGKAVHMSMTLHEKDKSTITGLGIRNKVIGAKTTAVQAFPQKGPSFPGGPLRQGSVQQPSIQSPPSPDVQAEEQAPPKPPRPGPASPKPQQAARTPPFPTSNSAPYDRKPTALTPSWPAVQHSTFNKSNLSSPLPPTYEQAVTPPSRYQTPVSELATTTGHDYFGNGVGSSNNDNQRPLSTATTSTNAGSVAAAAKKKAPPPVPAKRAVSGAPQQFVTAIFDFEGQAEGDLRFREGDRILVIKKTESVDDWWVGEVGGRRGEFPANYVKQ